MKIEIGAYDAKTRLPEILRRVSHGSRFTITNRGKPVADLIPPEDDDKQDVRSAISSLKTFNKGRKLPKDVTIRSLIETGRK